MTTVAPVPVTALATTYVARYVPTLPPELQAHVWAAYQAGIEKGLKVARDEDRG